MAEPTSQPARTSAPSGRLDSVFVGRQREMAELGAALDDALAGHGRLVMLVGEPGIGKTRTAQELASQAEQQGAKVFWGWCYEGEGAPPYWPWVQPIRSHVQQSDLEQLQAWMGPGAADIAEIIPEVGARITNLDAPSPVQPEQARFRLFDSICCYLRNSARSRPLVIVLDDIHWADKPSLLLLQFLARELADSHLMLIGCYRDVELSPQHPLSETLAQLIRESVFQRHLLRGLSREDTQRFIEATVGRRPLQSLEETIFANTEGNPFFMTEVIRLLSERGELITEEVGRHHRIGVPEAVREVVGQRLKRLSKQCNQMLTVGSIIGREFSLDLLERLLADAAPGSGQAFYEDRLLEVIEEALAARLIDESPEIIGRYQFTHALIQETLATTVTAMRRGRIHRRIAETLEELYGTKADAHAAALAHHFVAAVAPTDTEKLVRYSLLAGEQALAAYSWEEALEHFQRGLEAREGQAMDAETAELLFGLARAQRSTLARYRLHEVVNTLRLAFDQYVVVGDVPMAVAAAEYPFSFRAPGMTQLLGDALKLVPPDSQQAGRLLARYGRALTHHPGDYEAGISTLDQALAIAQRSNDLALERRVLTTLADIHYYRLQYPECLKNSLRAIDLVQHVGQPQTEEDFLFPPHWTALRALIALGSIEDAWGHAAAELVRAERHRDRFSLTQALHGNSVLAHLQGNWQVARDFSDRALAVDHRDVRHLHNRAIMEYQPGEFGEGDVYLERLVETMHLSPPGPTLERSNAPMTIGVACRISGTDSHADTAEEAAQVVLSAPAVLPFYAQAVRTGLALLAVQRGDVATAGDQYTALKPWPITITVMNLVCGHRVLGLLAQTMGNLDQAMDHFEDSLAFCQKAGCRPELAWTCYDHAEALLHKGDAGDHAKAISMLNEALAMSSELGMRPLMERVLALQERAETQVSKTPAYPDGLTQREVEVLRLVAAGKSNPEIANEHVVSIRTVTTHVSNIFAKINAANRVEVATYATRHGLV